MIRTATQPRGRGDRASRTVRRMRAAYLRGIELAGDAPDGEYPFDIPAVRALRDGIELAPVTVLVGDNGSGKSTLTEAIAVRAGFNAEGGSRHLRFETTATHSELHRHLTWRFARQPPYGWFLRAETFYGMATAGAHIERFGDFHSRSHGESFLDLLASRFAGAGLYVLDEPESALSFGGQLQLLRIIHDGVAAGSQFVVATHSPILMRAPGARIYVLDAGGIHQSAWEDLDVVSFWRRFLEAPERILDVVLGDD